MAKILTGVQSTGTPHLGNLLGAIIPAIHNDPKMNHSFSLPIYIPLPK
jgi:tryptophanyl-tRNA synthetase